MIPLFASLALGAPADADEVARLRAEVADLRATLSSRDNPSAAHTGRDADRVYFTGSVVVGSGETVESAVSFTGDVDVAGRVTGEATSFGGDVVVRDGGVVEGDATSFGGRVVVEPGGILRGDRVSFGLPAALGPNSEAPDHDEGQGEEEASASQGPSFGSLLYRRLVLTLSLAGAGVLAVGVFPTRVSHVAAAIERRPFHSAIVGALGTGFVVLFALLLTVVTLGLGSPVALLLLGALCVAWMLGFVGLSQAVGDRLPIKQRPHGRWVAFLVGVLLVTSAGSLPWVGWLVLGAAGVVGIGAAFSTRFGATAQGASH